MSNLGGKHVQYKIKFIPTLATSSKSSSLIGGEMIAIILGLKKKKRKTERWSKLNVNSDIREKKRKKKKAQRGM